MFMIILKESAKLRAMSAIHAYVSACLRAYAPCVPPKFACIACLRALGAYVFCNSSIMTRIYKSEADTKDYECK